MAAPTAVADLAGTYMKSWLISTAADADTGDVALTHSLNKPRVGLRVVLTPLTAAGVLAQYSAAFTDDNTLTVSKNSTQASSGGANQLLVHVEAIHTLIK